MSVTFQSVTFLIRSIIPRYIPIFFGIDADIVISQLEQPQKQMTVSNH